MTALTRADGHTVVLHPVTPVAEGAPWTPDDARYDMHGTATRLGISYSGVWRLVRSGELGHYRVGGRVQVTEGQIRQYLAQAERPAVPPQERLREELKQARAAARKRSRP